ncbi:MAG: hypothetical protein IT297_07385 [Anaerolineae bacterium]|jgi:hypothetical protein|nr:hypothetical protein [Anaerolineae bacterium]MCZ7552223.1 intracellular growth attenuator family protein [Anaerolineales bacterium]
MSRERRSSLVLGLLLVLAGGWLLARQFYPGLHIWRYFNFSWPALVIGAGLLLLLLGLLFGAPRMAIPACIVGGIGGLFYYLRETGGWQSWTYVWTLIPGFAGIGIILAGLLEGRFRHGLREGGALVIISAMLFVVFGVLLGGPSLLGKYWPLLLILVGAWILVQPLLQRGLRSS